MRLSQIAKLPKQETTIMKRYYLVYCRKSTEAEDRQVSSIEDQEKVLLDLAKQKQLPILKIYRESKSAKEPGRQEFNNMMALIQKKGNIKGILCWKLNRLHRNPKDAGDLQWLLQSGKIDEVVTPTKTYTEADSDFVMAVEGAQANRFIRDLKEDTLRGLNSKLDKGIAPVLAPVGYYNDKMKNQGQRDILPHPTYFTLVRRLFDLALSNEYSIQALGEKAKDMGIRNNRGVPISRTQMYRVLTNPFYTGRFLYKGVLHQGIHKRMLSDAEFDLLQDIVASKSHPRGDLNYAPLNGFIRCGYCNYMITSEFKKKKYKNGDMGRFNYYRCSHKRSDQCPNAYIRADELETQVCNYLKTIQLSPKFVTWAIKALNETNKHQQESKEIRYQALKNAYEGVSKRIQNLFDLRISPANTDQSLITDDEYRQQRQKLLIEKDGIKEQMDNLDQTVDDFMELSVKTFDFAAKAVEKWEKGTLADKRTILTAIGESLILKDGWLEIQPRTPFLMIQNAIAKNVIIGPKTRWQVERYKDPNYQVKKFMSIRGD